MAKLELNLLENATDSLNEALKKYSEGQNGDISSYKFAILHFAHFIELVFKFYVSQSHELLIYKHPFSKNIEKENTIGVMDALQFLKNEGHDVPKQFEDDLIWFKKLRNDIEHFQFSMDTDQVKEALGRLMQAVNEFNEVAADFNLRDLVEPKLLNTFEVLADEYKAKVAKAVEEAKAAGGSNEWSICWDCGNTDTLSLNQNKYQCHFCEEESDQTDCVICGMPMPEAEGHIWNDDHPDHITYICAGCDERMSHGWE